MRGTFRIGRILGIPVTVNPSWFLILALVVTTLATRAFPQVKELRDRPEWFFWALALGAALVFFASMVLHELGHSIVARYFDIPVRSITLFALGAVAQTTRESRRAGHEFLMAAAGPAVSILLGGAFMALWFVTGARQDSPLVVLEWLWITNVAVGLFNLLPAYPMDGGRVLRSVLWALLHSQRRATHWAALTGRALAFLMIGTGILAAFRWPPPFEHLGSVMAVQFILIGLFINYAASQSDVHSGLLDFLSGHRVAEVMLRDLPAALAGTSVREALAGPLSGYGDAREWLLLSDGGRFAGLAPRRALQALPEERWDATPVSALSIGADRLHAATPDEPLSEAVQRMDAEQAPLLVVVDGGEVAGIVSREQVAVLMRGRGGRTRG